MVGPPVAPLPLWLAERDMGTAAIEKLAAWSSIDDGDTWTEVDVTDVGDGTYEGDIAIPASCDPSCFVSLRVEATDVDGSWLEQTITRAYAADYVVPTSTPVPTTTLPPTGGGDTGVLVGLGLVVLLAGAVTVLLARRRLIK